MNTTFTVKDLCLYLDKIAPVKLSASWDNSGLLAGLMDDKIENILLALDVTSKVVDYAIETGVDLIISHHPLFLNPLKKINDPLLVNLIRHKIGLYCMHTNLDFVNNGVNTELAELLNLEKTVFLSQLPDIINYHVAIYTPPHAEDAVKEAVFSAGGGIIGNYSHCLNKYHVDGQFKPNTGSHPTVGKRGLIEEVQELKIEFFTDSVHLDRVLAAMIESHPYETPAYTVCELNQPCLHYGLGLVGELPQPLTLKELALFVKKTLGTPFVKLWLAGKPQDELVKKVAVCGGNGSDLINYAQEKADVYITGDLKYHTLLNSSIPLIDSGHFYTEFPVLSRLKKQLDPLQVNVELFPKDSADIRNLLLL